jgi:organic hydroperoxide reductase OsmC/OhrA
MKEHPYKIQINWTGNRGAGTSAYNEYDRSHQLHIAGKQDLYCSSDPAFRGDATKHNPEEQFLYSIASCHMLWYLHLCADAGIVVIEYQDNPTALMVQNELGIGRFTTVSLHPKVRVTDATKISLALALHEKAHQYCFIANSCNFPVLFQPSCEA